MNIEPLESRIAPAALITFTDVDGDAVTISSSKGTSADLQAAAHFDITGHILQELAVNTTTFAGANLSITAKPMGTGEGFVDVGYVNGTGVDLGAVVVHGDLGKITAGDAKEKTPALKSLTVQSLGVEGMATGAPDNVCDIDGPVGSLNVAGDVRNAALFVQPSNFPDSGTIGSITIGGSLIGGANDFTGDIEAFGNIGAVKIGGDVSGGSGKSSGRILSSTAIKTFTVGGSLLGGAGDFSGSVAVDNFGKGLGPVKIGRNVVGHDGFDSGRIDSGTALASVTIGGSVVGGLGGQSAQIGCATDMGPVIVGHDVTGGDGVASARIKPSGNLKSLSIGGSLIGGHRLESGYVDVVGNSGPIHIGGDVVGATSDYLGGLASFSGAISVNGKLAGVTVGGSLIGGKFQDGGRISSGLELGPVSIGHDVIGGDGSGSGGVKGFGKLDGVRIGGSLRGGGGSDSGAIESDSDIGYVTIAQDVIGGSGSHSGAIVSTHNVARIFIGDSLVGGSASAGTLTGSGEISVGNAKLITIAGDIVGGCAGGSASVTGSGAVIADHLDKMFVFGSVRSGADTSSGTIASSGSINVAHDIVSLVIDGSVIGQPDTGSGASPVVISALGQAKPGKTSDVAIGALTILGSVQDLNVLAGYDTSLAAINGDAQIGHVFVAGSWTAGNLVAGAANDAGTLPTADDNLNFGDAGDHSIGTGSASILARIASISIGGRISGSPGGTDHFGFVAQQIGRFVIGGTPLTLTASYDLGPTGDVTIHLI